MKKAALFFLALGVTAGAFAQTTLIMPDSGNNRLVSFDPFDGSVINSNLFGLAGGTPIQAIQVGNEIWVSEQVGDRVSRWSMTGTSLGQISGGLDNVRGLSLIGNTVYVCNAGTSNNAPGPAIVEYDTSGGFLGSFATPEASGPFSILSYQGGMLVGSNNSSDDIHKYSLGGSSLGTFHDGTDTNFVEQMNYDANGNVLASCFSSGGIAILNSADGSSLGSIGPGTGNRGVYQLGNGNILYSNSSGAFVFNVTTGGSTQVYTGSGRFFSELSAPVPEPASLLVLGLGAVALLRRRKQ
ncbi:MAG: PEP-CTERM sorting domain-containing protein [Armatimonadetes bacterium]|nr:PEP-CTERM sorting domain-containing protein [Armatimonadota bacterium]